MLSAKVYATLLLLGMIFAAPAVAQPAPASPAVAPNPWWRGYEVAHLVRTPDGRRLRVYCMGTGQPTVVLESGLGDGAWTWRTVQPAMAKTTRVCSYDRAGLGLSDEAHGPRDVDAMAADLAVVVSAAGHGRPVILVSHSLGGSIIRQYAYRHTRMVAGIVQVDPSSDHQIERFSAINESLGKPPPGPDRARDCLGLTEKGPILEGTPDYRRCVGPPPADMPADLVHFHVQYGLSPIHSREIIAERDGAVGGANDREADGARRPLGNLPMIVLTSGVAPKPPMLTPAEQARFALTPYLMHNEIAALSTNARHRVVAGATHYIQYDQPQAVIEAVAEVVADARVR